jgi:hypothetical protein
MPHYARVAGPVVCVGALALAACGTKVIDQGKAEKFTKQVVVANGATAKSIKCPSDVEVKKGKTFTCTAALTNGQSFKLTFQMTDGKGTVKFVKVSKS